MLQHPESQEESLKAPLSLTWGGEGSSAEESLLGCFFVIAPLWGGGPVVCSCCDVPLMEGALLWHSPFGDSPS